MGDAVPSPATVGMSADVASLLHAHGIDAAESPFLYGDGYSGARLSSFERDDQRYVLKRMRFQDDWIMRFLQDEQCREAQFAASGFGARLPRFVRAPTLGAARDGDGWAILMRDITPLMLPGDGIVLEETVVTLLRALAGMHAAFWGDPLAGEAFPLRTMRDRVTLLSPDVGAALIDEGRDFGLAEGWQAFDRRAPREAIELAHALFADFTPLLRALDALPATLNHGDAKFGNAGIDGETLWLIDWAGVAVAPVAVEMAWFLGVNSSRLPWTLDETIARYERLLGEALGAERFAAAVWPRQLAALRVCGLMLYGWGKALDAEAGRPDELRWWCEGAIEGARVLGL